MTNSPEIFFQRLSQRVVVLLALIMLPALLASGLRAFTVDGAYDVVILQAVVYAWIVYLALPLSRTSFAVRTYSLVGIGVAVGVGALIRNPDPGVGMAWLIVASVFLSAVNTGPARYIFIAAVFPTAAVISHLASQSGWMALISHALAMAGMAAVANMLVGGIVAHTKGRLQEEIKLRQERDYALAELAREQARRDLVAGAADIAYLEYDYATGMLNGDLALQRRYGRNADDGAIDLSSRFNDFPVDSFELLQQYIGEMSLQPAGAEKTFVHHQFIGEEPTLRTLRVTGLNVERDGQLLFMGASVDITTESEAVEVASRFAAQLELMAKAGGIGMHTYFPATDMVRFNTFNADAAGRFDISSKADLVPAAEMRKFLTPDSLKKRYQLNEELAQMPAGNVQRFDEHLVGVNGKEMSLRVARMRQKVGAEDVYLSLSIDVTDEVQAREQAETAMSKLAQQQDRQAQMYAVIGHELRTPAASLQMMLDDLGDGESLDSALARANIEQLLSVIDTLRAVAQPERMAQATYDDVQLDEMLQQQAQSFQALASRYSIKLKTDFTGLTGHPVYIQKTLLRQVLSNLIKNALIHSGGTELEVGASGRMPDRGRTALRLWIADNGKGVSADKVEKLFEAFVRGSTDAEGTGLGLHICREIIQNMGGDLRYEPRPEGGACFVIELEVDLAKAEPSEQLKPQANESPLKGMRVLLAEDNKTIQMLTQKMLEKQGAQVTVGNNGKEALEAFEPGKFDLVLSDIFMPEMNGYEFAREVRRVNTKVPLIGLTAATIGKETDEMLSAGASTVLSKPISLSKLLTKLAEIELAQNPA